MSLNFESPCLISLYLNAHVALSNLRFNGHPPDILRGRERGRGDERKRKVWFSVLLSFIIIHNHL